IMTGTAFIGASVTAVFITKIIQKKENMHHNYLKNILLPYDGIIYFSVYIAVIILLMCVLHPFSRKMIVFDVIIIIISYLSMTKTKYSCTWGMYIDEEEICYIHIKKHYMSIGDIAGIKIEKAQHIADGSIVDYKTSDDYIYCMLFLNKVEVGMNAEYYGSINFRQKFPERVTAQTIYDAEVIDYFKKRNPNIIVMSDIRRREEIYP
ncbi:MAG: hypothetical protein J1F64_00300, partial [Oscillospiraceae bacterium]|nr:hypothetical protein [Oscillospiraceae bacterium]